MAFGKFNIHVDKSEEPPRGILKTFDLFTIGLGATIGPGVVTMVGYGISYTGYSVWLAYLTAILWGLVFCIPYIFFAATFRSSGGPYSIVGGCLNEFWAGVKGISGVPQLICTALYGAAFGQYMQSLIPAVSSRVWGCGLIITFCIINLLGIQSISRWQNAMFVIMLAAMAVFIFLGIPKISQPIFDVSNKDFFSNGFEHGFFPAVVLLAGSTTGYLALLPAYGPFCKNATRDIPRAALLCVPVLAVVYLGTTFVAEGILPLSESVGQPLTYAAQMVFPGKWYVAFVLLGPILCIATTINGSMPSMCQSVVACADNGWLPAIFAKRNKRGMASFTYIFATVVGCIPVAIGYNASQIVMWITLLGSLTAIPLQIAFYLLPTKHPEAWKNSRWHIPNWLYYIICTLSSACVVFNAYNSSKTLTAPLVMINVVIVAAVFLYSYLRARSGSLKCAYSLWPRSYLNDDSLPSPQAKL